MERVWVYCRVAYPEADMLEIQKSSLMAFAYGHNYTVSGVTVEQSSGLDLSR